MGESAQVRSGRGGSGSSRRTTGEAKTGKDAEETTTDPRKEAMSELSTEQRAARKKSRKAAKSLPPPTPDPQMLRSLEIFEGLHANQLNTLAEHAEGICLKRDQMLASPGEQHPDPFFNFIIAGQVGCAEHTESAQN